MKRFKLFFLLVLYCSSLPAIVPALEREVNLTFNNERFSNALLKIQEQTGLIFSYKSDIINNIGPVSLQLKHKTVREALALMLPKSIVYKSRSNYIILKEKAEEPNARKTEISGYVIDKTTEKKVANVTIYNKESLKSVTTDEYGYYSITVPKENEKFSVNKENYKDTAIVVTVAKDSKINNIEIAPVSDSLRRQDSASWRDKLKDIGLYTGRIYDKFRGFVNTLNVRDTLTRTFQVSLLPFVGTNHMLSGNVTNRFSFNVIGGFAKGVQGTELGGVFNIDRESVKGVQIAGLFNIVGDSVKGTQISSLFNITGSSVSGFQGAGLMNINEGRQRGGQVAGLMNINDNSTEGASVAGLMNITQKVKGAHVAGMCNITDTLMGVAVSGMFNISGDGEYSAQVAGLFNNQKKGSTAAQVSLFLNSTTYLKGVQVGLLNFADSAKGIPVGLFSFVKKGVHQIEFHSDEMFYTNFGFRTGVPNFYNYFSIGSNNTSNKDLWQFGYGVGTSFRLAPRRWRGDVILSMHHISSDNFFFGTSELCRLYTGVEFRVAKKFTIAAGPTLNLYWSDLLLPDYKTTYYNVPAYYLFDSNTANDFNLKGWIGGRFSLRFL